MRLCGVPVPTALIMRGDGHTRYHDDGRGWDVFVSVTLPVIGEIVRYEGAVRLTEDDAPRPR